MQPVSMSETAVIAADDDRVNSFALQKYAERLGCPITLAGDGQELLELMKRRPYQLVLMDIEMPRMDGVEATRRIRAGEGGEANRAVPVIAMTAHSSGDFTKKLRDAGMDGFLGKPIVFEDFDLRFSAVGDAFHVSGEFQDVASSGFLLVPFGV